MSPSFPSPNSFYFTQLASLIPFTFPKFTSKEGPSPLKEGEPFW
jgi:hypothetical protein